ncbi:MULTISPECIES: preprotein translocase subunit SecY [Methanobacterium]|uniref:Protein translocase subunit SecY n=1 Tax=Methanobacterium subterraneum TaxID=59277 RepID=A0A2H4VDB3_9EURY|nr:MULTISPECIES: preprotein translocase subunit SecY [Methanobacterium]MBW4257760.1 preprotein translocase subunit SecY [Methanobacterium sp. YSL]AUB56072.1 preprotein translocase subunit SecY [Methanobacterium subterraneum]AUB56897.1 preprotein translocase subunit SecY [Methanobacterium sp. MZ-A1]AUB60053.1 preprotein translocase subunit SecY [Methanobacterium subterraneum]MCC7560252.1 preprotein translocase subunit SecY [Methanobacterium sp.]
MLKEALLPIFSYLPQVKSPSYRVPFKEKLKWTGVILILYFILSQIPLFGLSPTAVDQFSQLRAVMAGSFGSIITLGIGPIVSASIILQLLVGGKILNLDLSQHDDKAFFQGTQKLLAVIFTLFEGGVLVLTGSLSASTPSLVWVMILQITIGGILIIFLDEVISKWGFGSGVGLFIVAGVSSQIVTGSLNPLSSPTSPGVPSGAIPQFLYLLTTSQPDFSLLIPIIALVAVFLVVVYAESMRVEIPLSFGGVKGARGKYPLKFIYASNMPVILTSALLLNVQLFAALFQKLGFPILGTVSNGRAISGVAYYLTTPYGLSSLLTNPLQVAIYGVVFIASCVLFAWLWVELSNIGPKAVAKQLHGMGMQIPGFRSSRTQFERLLKKYIPAITVLGGAFVGLLAFGADLTGALGGGTGVLLTVGIVYKLYEEIAQEQLMDMHPMLRKFLGD